MIKRIWPVALVVGSNIIYHICAKEIPSDMDAFASLTITYAVSFIATIICYLIFKKLPEVKVLAKRFARPTWPLSPSVLSSLGSSLDG